MTPRRQFTRNLLIVLISTSLVATLTLFYNVRPLSSRRSKTETPNPHTFLELPLLVDHSSKTQKILGDDQKNVPVDDDEDTAEANPEDYQVQTGDRVSFIDNTNMDNLDEPETATDLEVTEHIPDIFILDQFDPKLIQYIRDHHLTPPSKLPYANMTQFGLHPNWYSSYVDNLFKQKKGSKTFIEAGAYDGEAASNSLYLEEMGWTGLLVECNPETLPKLLGKNRKSWIANVCLSPSNTPKLMNFTSLINWPASSKLGRPLNSAEMTKHGLDWTNKTWSNYQIPCFPLYSIIKAVGDLSEIDFLSLDVEGAEKSILKAFPFDKMKIKVMIVEVHTFTDPEKADLREFMGKKGYELREKIQNDDIYVLKTETDLK